MPKFGEINYLKLIGAEGTRHALEKPFSDGGCGRYLADLGAVFNLLPEPPARVLDLGVGPGWTSVFLARRGYQVVGQDICADMIELANRNRDRYAAQSATFVVQDYEAMQYRAEFDAAVFYDALHHAENERTALGAVYAALKPGGICIAIEPGEGHAAASVAVSAELGVTEKDMPPHHVITLAREVGFQSFRVYARTQNPVLLVGVDARAPLWSPIPTRWRVAAGYARKALRSLLKGPRDADREFLFRVPPDSVLRSGNVVWMQK